MDLLKMVVFVPSAQADAFRQAIGDAGGGKIGNYSHCSFTSKGIGRFKPLEGAKPAIGEVGKFEQVEEERVEFTCPKEMAKEMIAVIKKVHPYEEVAFDIFQILDEEEL